MPRAVLSTAAVALVRTFQRLGFDPGRVEEFLGPEASQALYRGEPAAVEFFLDSGQLSQLIRIFYLHLVLPFPEIAAAIGEDVARQLCVAGVLRRPEVGTDCALGQGEEAQVDASYRCVLDIRAHRFQDNYQWVLSDMDASMVEGHVPGSEHVLGVGAASQSLQRILPKTPCHRLLDLGTGSGVQALAQLPLVDYVVATDVHPRALDLAEATCMANGYIPGVDFELREGSWFAPVEGETFERIVANPPFVVGPSTIEHIYRDSGLGLDGASQTTIRGACAHLAPGGRAYVLAAWVDSEQPWQSRVSSWFPPTGYRTWVLQRDHVDPLVYISTWLEDESLDLRSEQAKTRTHAWLDHFAEHDVSGIGFGWVVVEKLTEDLPTEVVAEELRHATDDYLGAEVEEYFLRQQWLSEQDTHSMLNARFGSRPGLAREVVEQADTDFSFKPAVIRLSRVEGPRFSHEVDEHISAIVAGLHPQGLALGEVLELYCYAHGLEDSQAFQAEAVGAIVDLIRHGLVLPADLLGEVEE